MSVKTCYLESTTNLIKWETVARTEGRGPDSTVRYTDGGWNPGKDCFFTEEQCRQYHGMPAKKAADRLERISDKLEKMAAALRGEQ